MNHSTFYPKLALNSQNCEWEIRDLGIQKKTIPDLGSGSATLLESDCVDRPESCLVWKYHSTVPWLSPEPDCLDRPESGLVWKWYLAEPRADRNSSILSETILASSAISSTLSWKKLHKLHVSSPKNSSTQWVSKSRKFLGLDLDLDLDPSLFVRIRIRMLKSSSKTERKTLIYTVLWLFMTFLSLNTDVNVPSKSNKTF
jgi:hypothetical protein